jgi:predicted esterase
MAQPVEPDDPFALRYLVVHGHRRAFRMTGSGPVLLLLHGLGCDSSTWLPVMTGLAERFTVIAPDPETRRNRAATTPWAVTPTACATC